MILHEAGLPARTVSGVTETLSYLGTTEAVVRLDTGSGVTDAAITAKGDRTAVKVGGVGRFTLPDLHGNTAASILAADGTTAEALRYDAFGELVDAWPGSGTPSAFARWKFQGNLDVSPTADALYENGFRFYSPGLATFTGVDTLIGQAESPLSTNRYLYAGASPWTLTDPTGHFFDNLNLDPGRFLGETVGNVGNFALGFGEGAVGAVGATVEGAVGLAKGAVAAGGCAIDGGCRDRAVKDLSAVARRVARDPGLVVKAAEGAAKGVVESVGAAVDKVGRSWADGDFRTLGKMAGEQAVGFVPVAGMAARGATALRGLNQATKALNYASSAAAKVDRVTDGGPPQIRASVEAAVSVSREARTASKFQDPLTFWARKQVEREAADVAKQGRGALLGSGRRRFGGADRFVVGHEVHRQTFLGLRAAMRKKQIELKYNPTRGIDYRFQFGYRTVDIELTTWPWAWIKAAKYGIRIGQVATYRVRRH